jgi:hypothetical protein
MLHLVQSQEELPQWIVRRHKTTSAETGVIGHFDFAHQDPAT